MGKKAKKKAKAVAKEVKRDNMVGYGYGYGRGETKKVAVVGELEVYAGPFSGAREVDPDFYISLNGATLRPVVMDLGLGLTYEAKSPKGISIDWPDFGVPPLPREFWQALAARLKGERGKLFIGCTAGHGRTGTALAILGYFWGLTKTPIAWVREVYSPMAVETEGQVEYVAQITGVKEKVKGSETPLVSYGYSYGYGAYGNYLGRSEGYSDMVARIAAVVARDVDAKKLLDRRGDIALQVEEDDDAVYITGYVGEVGVVPQTRTQSKLWEVSLWDACEAKTEACSLLSKSALLRQFIVRENAIARFADELGLDPSYINASCYEDVYGFAVDEEGNFIAKDGNKLTPEEAAKTLFGE